MLSFASISFPVANPSCLFINAFIPLLNNFSRLTRTFFYTHFSLGEKEAVPGGRGGLLACELRFYRPEPCAAFDRTGGGQDRLEITAESPGSLSRQAIDKQQN